MMDEKRMVSRSATLRLLSSLISLAGLFLVTGFLAGVSAGATLPSAPTEYCTDYTKTVRPETVQLLNQRLAAFERETSNQILVAIFEKLPDDAALEDYTQDIYRAWKPGQAGRDNGAIFFVFVRDRKMRIQTGRGLEGALPDAICKRIISDVVAPRFQKGDFDAGVAAGVDAMIAATKGEFKGTGRTMAESREAGTGKTGGIGLFIFFLLLFLLIAYFNSRARRRGVVYSGRGARGLWIGPVGGGWSNWGGGGGGWGGGGSSGGGFSGGGGDSGGGGASGSW
jgi:uncharacterized protein